jgi:voltage-gated potassium channel
VARVAQLTRGLRLLNVFSSINRGKEALGQNLGRRGFGYMVGLSLLVIMVGAAGMYAFERDALHGAGFDSYRTALSTETVNRVETERTRSGRRLSRIS